MAFCITISFSIAGSLMAQKDTVRLEPVTVRGFVPERFMSGLKIQKIDSATLLTFRFKSISDLLSVNTPIAFKNYGPGQLSTASFRGTSANHTAVLWNGLNINSPTLGQTDFSTIPVAGFDHLSVQYGSAASIVGTDAVGGSILLGSTMHNHGFDVSVGRQQESFHNNQTQLFARYGHGSNGTQTFSGKTGVYYSRMNNRFPYAERRRYFMLPSETFQKGFIQDFFLKGKKGSQLSAHIWLTDNELTTVPKDLAARERTHTVSYRSMIRYEVKNWVIRTSWIRDRLDFAKGDYTSEDKAVTDKFTSRVERTFQYQLGEVSNINILAGAEWSFYRTRVDGYGQAVITENREDLFLLSRLQATARWLISLNLRQAFVTRFSPPFTPSFGTEYQLVHSSMHVLSVRGSVARSYRVPTLNERYWEVLGNPDIRPESGWNKEIGIYERVTLNSGHSLSGSVSGYHNRVTDWTYWNPVKDYHVENLQQVLARGLEARLGWNYRVNDWNAGASVGYAYTRSSQEKAYDAYSKDVIGKQLVYVPIHNGNFNGFVSYKKTKLSVQVSGISRRFSTFDNSGFLDGYALVNLITEKEATLHKINMLFQGRIENLTNAFYLNVRNNAMPGRSFSISLLLSYHNG